MEGNLGADLAANRTPEANVSEIADRTLEEFESEVAQTMEFGASLGIQTEGFENQIKKLVSGELRDTCLP